MSKRYYPKRRAKKRADPYSKCWPVVHEILGEIMSMLTWHRPKSNEYIRVAYAGTLMTLRQQCIKLLNVIDTYLDETGKQKKEDRWE